MRSGTIVGFICLSMLIPALNGYADQSAQPIHPHRYVTGDLVSASKKEIKLRTPEGEQVFQVEQGRVKFSALAEGTPVMVVLNQAGRITDLYHVEVETPLSIQAQREPGAPVASDRRKANPDPGLIF